MLKKIKQFIFLGAWFLLCLYTFCFVQRFYRRYSGWAAIFKDVFLLSVNTNSFRSRVIGRYWSAHRFFQSTCVVLTCYRFFSVNCAAYILFSTLYNFLCSRCCFYLLFLPLFSILIISRQSKYSQYQLPTHRYSV